MARKQKTKVNVQDEPSLERDTSSNAILNRDSHAYAMAVVRAQAQLQEQQRILSLEEEIAALKQLVNQLVSSSIQS